MSEVIEPPLTVPSLKSGWPCIALLATTMIAAYVSTLSSLFHGPWRSEQQGHAPLIIAASLWLMWRASHQMRFTSLVPAPISGWCMLAFGLALMFTARILGVLGGDVLSAIAILAGSVLLAGGRELLKSLAFPFALLLFAVPLPDWLIDNATLPLKVFISDAVTTSLYAMGYPVAHNGVTIVIGSYELLVKDACSGLNSIVALLAVGVLYVYAVRHHSMTRSLLVTIAIIPIAIAANFLRVLALVLVVYYWGVDLLDGPLHLLTGIGVFVLAAMLLIAFDGLLGVGCGQLMRRSA